MRESLFEADAAELLLSIKKADEFLEAVEVVLSRKPECGHHLSGSHVWFLAAYTLPLVVYYTYDDSVVCLLSMQETEVLEK